jgi:hypothetical protein
LRQAINYYFQDYAGLITKVIACERQRAVYAKSDLATHRCYYDLSGNLAAVEAICGIRTSLSSNLLHEITQLHSARIKDLTFPVGGRSSSSIKFPSGADSNMLSFQAFRQKAYQELDYRGKPTYDKSIYDQEAAWKITEEILR